MSFDNKYVQCRYMGTSTAAADFTNTVNWHEIIEYEVFNINSYLKRSTSFGNELVDLNIARQSVPLKYRKIGLVISYLTDYGWVTEQFIGGYELDLSDNTIWRNASYWKFVDNNQLVNINKLANNYSSYPSLRDALLSVIAFPEIKNKGAVVTFLQASQEKNQLIIDYSSVAANGSITITIDGNNYTVSYNSGDTRQAIFDRILALDIPDYTITSGGSTYVYITANSVGNKVPGSVATTTPIGCRMVEAIKGTNPNWRICQYINNTDSDYWTSEQYWQDIYVKKEEDIYAYLYSESFSESGAITYTNEAISSFNVKWSDGTAGVYTSTDWDSNSQMYRGYEVTYGEHYKLVQPAVTVENFKITNVPNKVVVEL